MRPAKRGSTNGDPPIMNLIGADDPARRAGLLDLALSSGTSAVGEWMKRSPSRQRITVIRVGNGILGQGMPKGMIGPSTIQRSSTTRFIRLRGG